MLSALQRHLNFIKTQGLKKYIEKAANIALIAPACEILFYPVYFIIFLLRPFILIRFSRFPSDRVGEVGQRMSLYVSDKTHGKDYIGSYDIFYYNGHVANQQLLKMWNSAVHLSYIASFFGRVLEKKSYRAIHHFHPYGNDRFGTRPETKPTVGFTDEEIRAAKSELAKFMPEPNRPYVALLTRDRGYLKKNFPDNDWSYHDHRNTTIANYRTAADYLAAQGNALIRLGTDVESPLESKSEHVIDYAWKNYRSDLLDIYISATCKFFISCGTGLDSTALNFLRPVLFVNYIPYIHCGHPNETTLVLPKLLYSKKENRLMTFKEIFASPACQYFISQKYVEDGIEVRENSAEEILEAVKEMDLRLSEKWISEAEDEELQKKFWSYYHTPETPEAPIKGRISATFLRKYRHLL